MEAVIFKNLIISGVAIFFVFLICHFLKKKAQSISLEKNIKRSRYIVMKRIISILGMLSSIVILVLIWGVDVKSLWVSVAGILAMIAVAFVAVWSLVANILAGLIIYFTSPFKIDDTIEMLPEGIKGKVLAINTFYTIIEEEDNNYINIPNSLFFQKYIRKIRTK